MMSYEAYAAAASSSAAAEHEVYKRTLAEMHTPEGAWAILKEYQDGEPQIAQVLKVKAAALSWGVRFSWRTIVAQVLCTDNVIRWVKFEEEHDNGSYDEPGGESASVEWFEREEDLVS